MNTNPQHNTGTVPQTQLALFHTLDEKLVKKSDVCIDSVVKWREHTFYNKVCDLLQHKHNERYKDTPDDQVPILTSLETMAAFEELWQCQGKRIGDSSLNSQILLFDLDVSIESLPTGSAQHLPQSVVLKQYLLHLVTQQILQGAHKAKISSRSYLRSQRFLKQDVFAQCFVFYICCKLLRRSGFIFQLPVYLWFLIQNTPILNPNILRKNSWHYLPYPKDLVEVWKELPKEKRTFEHTLEYALQQSPENQTHMQSLNTLTCFAEHGSFAAFVHKHRDTLHPEEVFTLFMQGLSLLAYLNFHLGFKHNDLHLKNILLRSRPAFDDLQEAPAKCWSADFVQLYFTDKHSLYCPNTAIKACLWDFEYGSFETFRQEKPEVNRTLYTNKFDGMDPGDWSADFVRVLTDLLLLKVLPPTFDLHLKSLLYIAVHKAPNVPFFVWYYFLFNTIVPSLLLLHHGGEYKPGVHWLPNMKPLREKNLFRIDMFYIHPKIKKHFPHFVQTPSAFLALSVNFQEELDKLQSLFKEQLQTHKTTTKQKQEQTQTRQRSTANKPKTN